MRNRSRAQSNPVERLRLAIDCMPVATREAMLEGLRSNERIIAGAYVDEHGGVCPMLAAHRHGARTDFISFARSWDRFTRAVRGSRRASERELAILIGHLEASLQETSGVELDEAIRDHRALCARSRRPGRPRGLRLPDEADPSGWILARRLRRRRSASGSEGARRDASALSRA
jgi:hypothetical protein